jgi:hypothetical protein
MCASPPTCIHISSYLFYMLFRVLYSHFEVKYVAVYTLFIHMYIYIHIYIHIHIYIQASYFHENIQTIL